MTAQVFDVREGKEQSKSSIVVVIPAYNEERFIGSVVLSVRQFAAPVIVVDDGSTDATSLIADAAGAVVLRHDVNRGKGVALESGFLKALDYSPDVVVTIDGDSQHVPDDVPQVVQPILNEEADIVIGSRYLDDQSDVPAHRIWGHRFFNFITNVLTGTKSSDSQSGFRAFSPHAIRAIGFKSDGFSVESEMQFLVNELGLRMVEVPITIRYLDRPKRSVIAHGMQVLNGIMQLIGQYRPLLFFGVPGAVVLLAGVLWGGWVIEVYRRTLTLAVGYAMISVLLTILGSLSLATGIILHSIRGLLIFFLSRMRNEG